MDPRKSGQAGTSCRAGDYLSNSDYAALRAMTVHEGVGAVILFGIIMQLLKLCGAILNFDFPGLRSPFSGFRSFQFINSDLILRHIDLSLFKI
ncbi:MAG: hypothetical protein WCP85_01745 [Mariniphaga sp.]